MIKIKDKTGKVKMVLKDEDEEPVSIDELVIKDIKKNEAEEKEDK